MPRTKRNLNDECYYHILLRGNNRRAIFHNGKDYQRYLEIFRHYRLRLTPKLLLHHYCLMSNYLHLLVRLDVAGEFPRLMQCVNQTYFHYYKKTYGYTGHLFQGRYKILHILSENYLLECGRYIERSPVRSNLVREPKDYLWSSYGFYAHGRSDHCLSLSPTYFNLGPSPTERQAAYRDYLLKEQPYEHLIDMKLVGQKR